MKPVCQELKSAFRKNEVVCARVNHLFHLFSNKGRFRIVCLLARGEFSVTEITEVVDEGKTSSVSQHLKMLTLSGIIQRRREDTRIFYSLRDKRIAKMIEFLQKEFLTKLTAEPEQVNIRP